VIVKILWVDDEIDQFKSHLLFLESEGLSVKTASSAPEALDVLARESFNLILLDYRMPGVDGLTLLREVKRIAPHVPVAMVTMMSDKEIMEEAVAAEAFDFVIKPIQPSQIVVIAKKASSEEVKRRKLGRELSDIYKRLSSLPETYQGWLAKARLLLETRTRIAGEDRKAVEEVLSSANEEFARWTTRNYPRLLSEGHNFSHNILERHLFPALRNGGKAVLFLVDCFRLDQFSSFASTLSSDLRIQTTDYMGILPSATGFSRNAIFAGILPKEIHASHPGWLDDNQNEQSLLAENLARNGLAGLDFTYRKLNTFEDLKRLSLSDKRLQVYIINFVDLMLHLRHELDVLKALGESVDSLLHWGEFLLKESELAFRVKAAVDRDFTVFITSDHGWVMAERPSVIHGGGDLTPGLRYKFGDSVRLVQNSGVIIKELVEWGLPAIPGAHRLLLATNYSFLVYSTDPRKYERHYRGGVFHGGISLEEMALPFIRVEK
jgi:CheY-like chemotaxis protein